MLHNFPSLLYKVNARTETASHLAAAKGDDDVVRAIINNDRLEGRWGTVFAPVDFIIKGNVDLDTALHLALKNKHRMVAESILVTYDFDGRLHFQNRKFETPLYLAGIAGDEYMVGTIFSNCKDSSVEGPEGSTALHAAVISHDPHARPSLYQRADNRGWTVFHYAASLNCERALDTLIEFMNRNEREVVMGMTSINQETAYHIAASQGHIYVLTALIKYCPEVFEALDEDGRNILHIAAEHSHTELIQSILYDYPHIFSKLLNVQDKKGNTPLHLLVIAGCFVPELIKHEGVDITLKNKDNFTAQDLLYMDEDIVGNQLKIKNAFLDIHNHRTITNSWSNIELKLWFKRIKSNGRRWRPNESILQENKRRRQDAKFQIAKTKIMKDEVELYREEQTPRY